MNHYLVTSLPRLPELGGAPPLEPGQLLERLADSPRAHELVALVFLAEDLTLRDAWRAGERELPAPAVLTPAQVRGDEPLPDALRADAAGAEPAWGAYFRHATGRAEAVGSPLLAAWLRFEVDLRAALAGARARTAGLEPSLPVPELAGQGMGAAEAAAAWAAEPDPLAAARTLDVARLAWVAAHEPWFSFADDELVAWALKLQLLRRWHRIDTGTRGAQA